MSKKVELIVEIDSAGKILVTPKGTTGVECLELMAFLDKISEMNIIETVANEDMRKNHKTSLKESIKDKLVD